MVKPLAQNHKARRARIQAWAVWLCCRSYMFMNAWVRAWTGPFKSQFSTPPCFEANTAIFSPTGLDWLWWKSSGVCGNLRGHPPVCEVLNPLSAHLPLRTEKGQCTPSSRAHWGWSSHPCFLAAVQALTVCMLGSVTASQAPPIKPLFVLYSCMKVESGSSRSLHK